MLSFRSSFSNYTKVPNHVIWVSYKVKKVSILVDNKCKGEYKSKWYFTKPHIVKNLLSQVKSGHGIEVAFAVKGVFKTSSELSQKS